MSQQPPNYPPNDGQQPPNQGGPYQPPQQPGQYPPQGGYPPQGQWQGQQPPPGYQYPPQQQGYYSGPPQMQPPRPPKKGGVPVWGWIVGGVVGLLVVFGIIGTLAKPATTTVVSVATATAVVAVAAPTSNTVASSDFVKATPTLNRQTVTAEAKGTATANAPTATARPTATERPVTTKTSGLFNPTPVPSTVALANGGLGLTLEEWQKIHGPGHKMDYSKVVGHQDTGTDDYYYDPPDTYGLTVQADRILYLSEDLGGDVGVSMKSAQAEAKKLIPADAKYVKSFSFNDMPVDLFTSDVLAGSFSDLAKTKDIWNGQPGSLVVLYEITPSNNVVRITLETGAQP